MKRVLFQNFSHGIGGVELNLIAFLRALDRSQFEPNVLLYCRDPEADSHIRHELQGLGVTVYDLTGEGFIGGKTSPKTENSSLGTRVIYSERGALNLKSIALALTPALVKRLRYFNCRAQEMSEWLREHRFDVFHCLHGSYPSMEFQLKAAQLAGIPIRISDILLNPVPYNELGYSRRKFFAKTAVEASTHVRSMSPQMTAQLMHYGFKDSVLREIPNGIDLKRFQNLPKKQDIRAELQLPQEVVLAAVPARLAEVKGQFFLMDALKRATVDCLHLLLIGDGPDKEALEKRVAHEGWQKRVHFLGFRSDVPRILSACDIGIQCSLNEGLAATLLEMMAAGLAVAASDVGGTSSVIQDGSNGWLFKSGDEAALAELLKALVALDKDKRQSIGHRARQTIIENYRIEDVFEQLQGLYR